MHICIRFFPCQNLPQCYAKWEHINLHLKTDHMLDYYIDPVNLHLKTDHIDYYIDPDGLQ